MPLKAIIFDFDGVIVDSERLIASSVIQFFNENKIEITEKEIKPFIGAGEQKLLEGIAKKYNFNLPINSRKELYDIYKRLIIGNLRLVDGFSLFMSECINMKYEIALVTSSDYSKMIASTKAVKLDIDIFKTIITGDDVKNKKPSPEGYLLAIKNLNINPKDVLVIEDSINGIIAAKSIGCKCLGITTTFAEKELIEADWVVNDFNSTSLKDIVW